ncbi:unnamed protein product [Clonostachys rosea]|uniref:Uncharacterized protein n=1 Tax=Bionectria ochroleuca TaxID=29856 RepID=A0ABY6UK50_BIOOC|nr:unnamed protein product [Clonostachys rosea]
MNRYPEDAPEVASHSYPESYNNHVQQAQINPQHYQSPSTAPSETPTTVYSQYAKHDNDIIYGQEHKEVLRGGGGVYDPHQEQKRIFGLPILVFILSVVIAIMGIIIIGLAAGLGVATHNYQQANTNLDAANANLTAATANLSAAKFVTSYSNLTNGCSDRAASVTGTKYSTHSYDFAEYTMYCNKDSPEGPIFSLFSGSFNSCMEACTTWNKYLDEKNYTSKACTTATYIPYWTNILMALGNSAPGDCYLKAGTANLKNFTSTGPDMEVHVAIHA